MLISWLFSHKFKVGKDRLMKRLVLALLILCINSIWCWAQVYFYEGIGTQEMEDGVGLSAAHLVLPVGSKALVTNVDNGRQAEVTITRQLMSSYDRVIDLSPSAARRLGIGVGEKGRVTVSSTGLSRPPQRNQPPVATPEPELKPAPEPIQPPSSINVTIHNNFVLPDKAPPESGVPETAVLPQKTTDTPEMAAVLLEKLAFLLGTSPEAFPPSVREVQVIPRIPDGNAIFRLQVGAYSVIDNAFIVLRYLQNGGFNAAIEQSGLVYRVLAWGIPAARVPDAIRRLGALGFRQVWVRE
jgi:hypothetical protein